METPNKIYAKIIAGSLHVSRKPNEIFGEPYPEYIRKDALLEWAREKKKQLFENESANDEPSDVAVGIIAGLDMLIGKLNSM